MEVRSDVADDSTLTQVLAYMSRLEGGKPPRGIIVAEGFTRKLEEAARLLETCEASENN